MLFEDFILYKLSEIKNKNVINTFSCKITPDIENFLKNRAIEFDKRDVSRTYLLIDIKDIKVVGYFALSITTLLTYNLSKNKIKKIDGFSKNKECLNFFLIGQLGIDDNYREKYKNKGLGKLLLGYAIKKIKKASQIIGGRFILVDAIKNDKVIKFYEENDFIILFEEEDSVKMIYEI